MASTTAVYAGSFDPITYGHLWMIKRASALFPNLIVAVGVNPAKKTMFSEQERIEMLETVIEKECFKSSVSVKSFTNQYLVSFAEEVGATHIIRGIRSEADFPYEQGMRNVNGDMCAERIDTVFLMPPRHLAEVSSSLVKSLIGPEHWQTVVQDFVPRCVYKKLKEMHS